MALYAAIDLHSSNNVLAVIDEQDRPLRRCRLPNQLASVLAELAPYRDELAGVAGVNLLAIPVVAISALFARGYVRGLTASMIEGA